MAAHKLLRNDKVAAVLAKKQAEVDTRMKVRLDAMELGAVTFEQAVANLRDFITTKLDGEQGSKNPLLSGEKP